MPNILESRPESLAGAVARLQIFAILRTGLALADLDQAARIVTGIQQIGGYLREATDNCPRVYFFELGDSLHVFIDGVATQAQGQLVADGYIGSQFFASPPGINASYMAAREDVYAFIFLVAQGKRRFFLNGYSSGGAISHYLFYKITDNLPLPLATFVTSFGSPAAYGEYLQEGPTPGGDFSSAAWFNSDDPVPIIPPRLGFWQGFWQQLGWRQQSHLASFAPLPRGRQVTLNHAVVATNLPTNVIAPATAAVGAWLQQQVQGVQNPHSVETYLSRFRAAAALVPQIGVPPANQQPAGPGVPVGPREVAARRGDFVELIVRDASRQNAQPLVIPNEQLFQVQRQGKLFAVYFGNLQVYLSPSKRSARAFKNSANRFLRLFQRGPVVNPGQMIEQLTTYLALASDPNGPFQPPLNVAP